MLKPCEQAVRQHVLEHSTRGIAAFPTEVDYSSGYTGRIDQAAKMRLRK